MMKYGFVCFIFFFLFPILLDKDMKISSVGTCVSLQLLFSLCLAVLVTVTFTLLKLQMMSSLI